MVTLLQPGSMSALRIVQMVCLVVSASVVMPQPYDDAFEVNYADTYYYNEIGEGGQKEGECVLISNTP